MRLKLFRRRRRKPPDALNHRHATPSPLNALSEIALEALYQSSDAFPPLKSATGSIKYMLSICDKVRSNKAACHQLVRRSEAVLCMIAEAVPDITRLSDDLLHRIENYALVVADIRHFMDHLHRRNVMSCMVHHKKDEGDLVELNRRLDIALMSFALVSSLKTEVTVSELETGVKESINIQSKLISHEMNKIINRFYVVFFGIPPGFGARQLIF